MQMGQENLGSVVASLTEKLRFYNNIFSPNKLYKGPWLSIHMEMLHLLGPVGRQGHRNDSYATSQCSDGSHTGHFRDQTPRPALSPKGLGELSPGPSFEHLNKRALCEQHIPLAGQFS